MRHVFVRFLGESSARTKTFREYLTFNNQTIIDVYNRKWEKYIFLSEEIILCSVQLTFMLLLEYFIGKRVHTIKFKKCYDQIIRGASILMPYPCSHFYFDIKFGDRLYSKENRPGQALLFSFEYNLSPNLISK